MVIKRYSNRKLYDTLNRRYITLEEVAQRIQKGEEIQVVDHETEADLTAQILTQIIFEQEKKAGGLLPTGILTRLVQAGDQQFQNLRDAAHAFLEPAHFADVEIRRRLKILVKEKTISEAQGRRLTDLLLDVRFHRMAAPISQPPAEEINPEEVEVLLKKLEDLESELKELRQLEGS
jgi:polyhydroxyalkanoate synthesis repressor PhaR